MKRLNKAVLIIIIFLLAETLAYSQSDSETITVNVVVMPLSGLEVDEGTAILEGMSAEKNSAGILVRTTLVEGERYSEVITYK